MKKIKIKDNNNRHFAYNRDIDRIVNIFADRGYEITRSDALKSWEMFSDSYAAGWMILDENDEDVFKNVFHYFE